MDYRFNDKGLNAEYNLAIARSKKEKGDDPAYRQRKNRSADKNDDGGSWNNGPGGSEVPVSGVCLEYISLVPRYKPPVSG